MSPTRLARVESAMRVVIEYNKLCNRHDVAGMMKLMSDDCVFENTLPAPDGSKYMGRIAIAQFWQEFFLQSPQAHFDTEEIFGLGERCIVRWRYEWSDTKGEKGHVRGVDLFKVKGTLITEKLSYVKG